MNRILIVEDDHDISEMIADYLSNEGYEVSKARWDECNEVYKERKLSTDYHYLSQG